MNNGSLRQFGGYLRERWISPGRIRFWLLVLIVLYTLLGFFGVPRVVQYLAVNTAREDFGRELHIEAIHANPYTLTLRINGFELKDTDDRLLIGWNSAFIDLAWVSIVNKAWTFQAIHFYQPIVQEERFDSGETRLSRLVAGRSDNSSAKKERSLLLPTMNADELRIDDGVLRVADNLQGATDDKSNEVSLALQDIELSIDDISLHKSMPFPMRVNGQLAEGGNLAFNGTLQLLPNVVLDGNTRLDALTLIQVEPYLRQFMNVRIDSGTLSLNGQMHIDAQQPLAYQGSASTKTLIIRDGTNDEPLIGWLSLQTEQFDLNLKDRQLGTGLIDIDGMSGLLVIHEERSTNFAQLMAAPRAKEDDNTGNNKEPTPFGITIAGIELTDGAFEFTDQSLPLLFSTDIYALSGKVSTLSSTSNEPAEVDLEGQIAEYGLVSVEGTVHAWNLTRETNLQVNFRNLQIPEYSPYTVRFAGRTIEDGTMDLDLGYTIKDKQLNGSNNLVLHDLKLGEKVATSNAMDLPLDLAIALLEDGDGVIDLDFPVTGNIGDPEFDIARIIRQALGDAIMSIVKSPSVFLANLLGTDSEGFGKIEFPEAGAELQPPQRARIATLRESLNQRPALIIGLAGPFSRGFDGPALQQVKAIEALRQRLAEAGRDITNPSLTTESNRDIVETMFRVYYPDVGLEPVQLGYIDSPDDPSDKAVFDALAYRNHLAEQIIAAQSVADADFIAIANARAIAVRDALAGSNKENGIAVNRLRILDPKEIESVEGEHIVMEVAITAD